MYIGFQSLSTVSHFGIEMEMDERERARTYALPIVMSHFLSQPLFLADLFFSLSQLALGKVYVYTVS